MVKFTGVLSYGRLILSIAKTGETMGFGKLFVISAPSGSGKTSLVRELLKKTDGYLLRRTITYTTRPPREGEIDGDHYHFISVEEFKDKIEKNYFIEWSTWYDHYYGSPASALQGIQEGYSYIMVLDRLGAKEVAQACPQQTVLIWIEPPSLKELERRLLGRGDGITLVQNRLRKAAIEIQQEKDECFYKYHIINDDLSVAVLQVQSLIKKELGV